MKQNDFTQGPILLPLIRFVFPIMFALLIQSLYGAVDLLIVGQFSDAVNVSAVSIFRIGLATPSSSMVQNILCFVYLYICRKRYLKVREMQDG